LLSDPDSKTIKAFGILNKEATGKAAGIPYPGTFLIDKNGVIRARLFLDGYKERHSAADLLKAAEQPFQGEFMSFVCDDAFPVIWRWQHEDASDCTSV
jgi:peroxiredoxin